MHAKCAHCEAVFRVTVRDLIAAKGMVRCSQCGGVFNAQHTLVTLPPEGGAQSESERDAETAALSDRQPNWASPTWLQTELSPPQRESNPFHARTMILLSAGTILLALLLLGQIFWYERERLVHHPLLGQPFMAACLWLGCEAPAGRDLAQIEVIERNVGSHPDAPDALLITAALINNASYAQPYPLLQVALTDLQGNITALRRFKPEEYLTTLPAALMVPGEPVDVRLEVVDPGRDTVAFEFKFF